MRQVHNGLQADAESSRRFYLIKTFYEILNLLPTADLLFVVKLIP